MPTLDSPAESLAPNAHLDTPALPVVEELPPEQPAVPAAADAAPSSEREPSRPSQASHPKDATTTSSPAASNAQSRKPQPVRRPLNRSMHQPAPATQRSLAPDSARVLRETAYFAAIPGENLVAPRPPASTGPANFPNSPFGKAAGGAGDVGKKGTVRVVGKNGSIANVPQRLMA